MSSGVCLGFEQKRLKVRVVIIIGKHACSIIKCNLSPSKDFITFRQDMIK